MGSNGLKEKYMKECVGKVLSSNNYGDFKIIKYLSANKVLVKFLETGTVVWCTSYVIRTGYTLVYHLYLYTSHYGL